jgi:ketosteroid isomerase-like protein
MKRTVIVIGAAVLLIVVIRVGATQFGTAAIRSNQSTDLDAYWTAVSQTIADGDFDGYAATYHPDAILVNESQQTSYPISQALAGWKQGFDDTKAGKMTASVEFRFTRTLRDATTAHQTGIFHYSSTPTGGEINEYYVHLEALLVNQDGWKMMMEYQRQPATLEEWAAAE